MKILKWIGIIILVLIVLAVLVPSSDKPTKVETSTEKSIEKNSNDITLEKFNKIQEGMTYAEVVEILGQEGEVSSSSDMAGYKTVLYTWKTQSLGGNMNAMFQNDSMISKAQFGLK